VRSIWVEELDLVVIGKGQFILETGSDAFSELACLGAEEVT